MEIGDKVRVKPAGWRVGIDGGRIGTITRKSQPDWASWDWDMWEVEFPDQLKPWTYGEGGKIFWFKGHNLEVIE